MRYKNLINSKRETRLDKQISSFLIFELSINSSIQKLPIFDNPPLINCNYVKIKQENEEFLIIFLKDYFNKNKLFFYIKIKLKLNNSSAKREILE